MPAELSISHAECNDTPLSREPMKMRGRERLSLWVSIRRYRYRRITSLLAGAGWQIGCDRVQLAP
jgi:hypothetical protein